MRTETETQRLEGAVHALSAFDIGDIDVALVLGSGLKNFAEQLTDPIEIPFHDIAHWPVPRVEGHGASLVVGSIGDNRIACLTGRAHLYEGWQPSDVVRPVRTLRVAGVNNFVLTNAAGGIGKGLSPGDLMVITDHVNQTGMSPLIGVHEEILGPRFPDQSYVYDAELRACLVAAEPSVRLGIYVGLLGPSYETPAEIKLLRRAGMHAVGMSTVHEAMALNAMGARVAGVSLITNLAAGIGDSPLSHGEVIETGKQASERFTTMLTGFCEGIRR